MLADEAKGTVRFQSRIQSVCVPSTRPTGPEQFISAHHKLSTSHFGLRAHILRRLELFQFPLVKPTQELRFGVPKQPTCVGLYETFWISVIWRIHFQQVRAVTGESDIYPDRARRTVDGQRISLP